jgi:hypothetical protein
MKIILSFLLSVVSFIALANTDRLRVQIKTGALHGTMEYNMNVFKNIRDVYPGVPHAFDISYVFGSYSLIP